MTTAQPAQIESTETSLNFDHRALRLTVGIIAFGLPIVVVLITRTITSSISASYHTDARDVFVGSLCVIAVLFLAYQGHEQEATGNTFWSWVRRHQESLISKFGGMAAAAAAFYPTACDGCDPDLKAYIHTAGAAILFSAVVYFCLVAFLQRAFSKFVEGSNMKFSFLLAVTYALQGDGRTFTIKRIKDKRRLRLYLFCGLLIAGIMLFSVFTSVALKALNVTFWAETVALILFGFAWLVASHVIPLFTDDQDLYTPLKKKK